MDPNPVKPSPYPPLPIVTLETPERSQREKYGGLFYLAVGGLIVLVVLVGWFGTRLWQLRDVWTNIYTLHDSKAAPEARLRSAFSLSRDSRVDQRQLWEMSLRRGLPELARYILAEGVSTDLVAADPRGYTVAVARSPDWPVWLRLVLARPLAYAASEGHTLPREPLSELCWQSDPETRLWALYSLAVLSRPDPQTVVELERAARAGDSGSGFAGILLKAVRSEGAQRRTSLDEATRWLRTHHPEASRIWQGWTVHDGRLVRSTSG